VVSNPAAPLGPSDLAVLVVDTVEPPLRAAATRVITEEVPYVVLVRRDVQPVRQPRVALLRQPGQPHQVGTALAKYIQGPAKGKGYALVQAGAAILSEAPVELPAQGFYVCVVDNGLFEAAAVVDSERDLHDFSLPDDKRPKAWLYFPFPLAELDAEVIG